VLVERRRMEELVWKRLIVLAVVLAASIPVELMATTAPASAAAPVCNATTATASWTAKVQYQYAPGGWCMKDPFSEVVFQSDGNLVWYLNNGEVLWKTDTCGKCRPGQRAVRLNFQLDGNIVIYRDTGAAMWAIGQGRDVNPKNTFFSWQVKRSTETCGLSNFKFTITHGQSNPDHTLNTIPACKP
jgi:hypothetical protein